MKKLRTKILLICLPALLVAFLFVYNTTKADNSIIQESAINIEITPENPGPYEDITIKISSYAIDVNKAMIVWQGGSKILLSGYGKTSYSFRTGGIDTASVFNIKITPAGSIDSIIKKIAIVPSEVDLLWEAEDGYTPPFYKGKAFLTKGASVKIVAIPNSTSIKSGKGDIVYNWKLNNNSMANVSGYNKDSFVFTNDTLNSKETVEVSISDIKNQYNAQNKITISPTVPKIIFYEKSPTLGILYNKGYSSSLNAKGETTIVAEPYFLSFYNMEGDFNYIWELNGDKIKTPSKKTELTFRPTSEGGYAELSIKIESLSRLFQTISNKLKINL